MGQETSVAKPYVIFGAGPSAAVMLMDIRSAGSALPECFLVDEGLRPAETLQGLPVSEDIAAFSGHEFVAAVARPPARRSVVERLIGRGLSPRSIFASDFDESVSVGDGAFLSRNVILDSFCSLGSHAFLRNGCFVGHHAKIGDFCYVAPRASIGGGSVVGAESFIGMGAVVRPGVHIGSRCLIGAGARVNDDVEDRTVVRSDGKTVRMKDPMRLLISEGAAS
jgi:sugar O-acyltransferase (sialic acid O-acetyltransferase NeuD family)